MYDKLVNSLRICGKMRSVDDYCVAFHDGCCEAEPVCMYELMMKAADAIEELQKREADMTHNMAALSLKVLRAEEKRPSWIPVTEQLPEQKKQVLVTGIEAIGNVQIYGVKQLDGDVWRPTSAPSCYWEHWMPLPEPPKEGET